MKQTHINASNFRQIVEGVVRKSLKEWAMDSYEEEEGGMNEALNKVLDMLSKAEEMLVDTCNSFTADDRLQAAESQLSGLIEDLQEIADGTPLEEDIPEDEEEF